MALSLFRPFGFDDDDEWWPFPLVDTDDHRRRRGGGRGKHGQGAGNQAVTGFMPRVDLVEKEGKAHATFELPGLRKDNVNITLDRGILTVSGSVNQEDKREEGNWRIQERRTGSFERAIRVHPSLKEKEIKASMDNGVLKIEYPVQAAESPAKRIAIS